VGGTVPNANRPDMLFGVRKFECGQPVISELATTFLASSSAIGRAPAPVVVGMSFVVLGIYALLKRRSLSSAFSRLRHRGDGGAPYALVFLIAPTVMVVVGVILLIVSKLFKLA
jgi:hypothetical protein